MAQRFPANVTYRIERRGNKYVVINVDRNRLMNKTHATRREAEAHVRQTKNRVKQVIGYHNRAPRAAQRRNRREPPPANRRGVSNVGRSANPRRGGRGAARNRGSGGQRSRTGNPEAGPSSAGRGPPRTPPRTTRASRMARGNTVVRNTRRTGTAPRRSTRTRRQAKNYTPGTGGN